MAAVSMAHGIESDKHGVMSWLVEARQACHIHIYRALIGAVEKSSYLKPFCIIKAAGRGVVAVHVAFEIYVQRLHGRHRAENGAKATWWPGGETVWPSARTRGSNNVVASTLIYLSRRRGHAWCWEKPAPSTSKMKQPAISSNAVLRRARRRRASARVSRKHHRLSACIINISACKNIKVAFIRGLSS